MIDSTQHGGQLISYFYQHKFLIFDNQPIDKSIISEIILTGMEHNVEILIIDDDLRTAELLRDTLEAIGYKAWALTRPDEAVDLLSSSPVDLVLIDNELARRNDYGPVKELKKRNTTIPVILIIGPLFNVNLDQIRKAGIDDFIQRPFRIEHIEKVIEDALAKYDFRQIELDAFMDKRALIVDDDNRLRSLLNEALRLIGYKTSVAINGNQALNLLMAARFDIVISDIRMPEMDGITLLREIKANYPQIPVVIITGYSHAYTRKKAIDAGADGFLSKPFRLKRIEEILNSFHGTAPFRFS